MIILIDGNNLIHKVAKLKKEFDKDKTASLMSLVESVMSRVPESVKVVFVFDGYNDFKKSNVIFSNDKTADEVIRKKIEGYSDYKKLKVVSSDRGITNFAKVCGAEIQKSEDFWNEISTAKSVTSGKNINQNYIYDDLEKPERMSKKEIDEFRKYFS